MSLRENCFELVRSRAGLARAHRNQAISAPTTCTGSPARCARSLQVRRHPRSIDCGAMPLKIVVYSKSACPQCESARMLLKSRNLPFEEVKIDDEAERLAFYAKCGPSVRQMPQVFINDQRVGGVAGLQAALAQLQGCSAAAASPPGVLP